MYILLKFSENILIYFCFWVRVSDLSTSESPLVVPLLAEPLHEAEAIGEETQSVLREQKVGRHLDVCGARLPR